MKIIFFTILLSLNAGSIFSQNTGDYRTRNYGNWSQIGRWQVFYYGEWQDLEDASAGPYRNIIPSDASGEIIIKNHIRVASSSVNANQIIIQSGGQLTILGGYTLTLVDDFVQTPLLIKAGGLLVNDGTLNLQAQLSTTPCEVYGTIESSFSIPSSNASLLQFKSGSVYKHFHRIGGVTPLATWDLNSTCVIGGLVNTNNTPPANLNQAFGNLIWNTPSMGPTTTFSLGGAPQNVNGDLTIVSTGTTPKEIRFKNGGAGYTLFIGGNFYIQNGTVTLTQNQTSLTSITVGGSLIMTGGTLTLGTANNSNVHFFMKGGFQKTGGLLKRGTGTGSFVILPATL
jgi:hypothetical protein